MSKNRQSNKQDKVNPRNFLERLGIKPIKSEKKAESKWNRLIEVCKENGLDTDRFADISVISPEANEYYFITEEIARNTLSSNYDRYVCHLKSFETLSGFPDNPARIADLGGGCGTVALWLAQKYPKAEVSVYDGSERSLIIGRKWAEDLGLSNIRFIKSLYENIAETSSIEENDLVIMFHGVDMRLEAPVLNGKFLLSDLYNPATGASNTDLQAVARAFNKLLKPNGVAVFAAGWTEWGLVTFFDEMRRVGINVDWRHTSIKTITKDCWNIAGDHYLFFRKSIPLITDSGLEDARGLIASCKPRQEQLTRESIESFSILFDGADILAQYVADRGSEGLERIRILKKGGLLFFEDIASTSDKRGFITGINPIIEVFNIFLNRLDIRRTENSVKEAFLCHKLESLLSFYEQEDQNRK